jgi:predicted nucleotidyltransferase
MNTMKELSKQRSPILAIAKKRGVLTIKVFGSVARGDADENSDIDFLVEMEKGRTLLDVGGLLMDLQELLKKKVDIVTIKALKPHVKEEVLREALPL